MPRLLRLNHTHTTNGCCKTPSKTSILPIRAAVCSCSGGSRKITIVQQDLLGRVIKDSPAQSIEDFLEYDIFIERLSSIIDANAGIDIPLVKLDTQGFVCQVMDGMDLNLVRIISTIKGEVASKFLREQKCENVLESFKSWDLQ